MNLLEKANYEFELLEKKSPDAVILNYKNEIRWVLKKYKCCIYIYTFFYFAFWVQSICF